MTRRREGFVEGHHYEVDPETGCWNWLLYRTYQGYGMASVVKGDGRERRAHRESWRLMNGPIPEGMVIDHLCRNKSCMNPEHLDCVRQAENVWRGDKAKLSQEDVDRIRERILAGDTLTAIGKDYGVHLDAIYRIAEDDRWREDPDAPRKPLKAVRTCPECAATVEGGRRSRRYCSTLCRRRFNARASYERLKAKRAPAPSFELSKEDPSDD